MAENYRDRAGRRHQRHLLTPEQRQIRPLPEPGSDARRMNVRSSSANPPSSPTAAPPVAPPVSCPLPCRSVYETRPRRGQAGSATFATGCYARSDMFDRRRELMSDWAAYLHGVRWRRRSSDPPAGSAPVQQPPGVLAGYRRPAADRGRGQTARAGHRRAWPCRCCDRETAVHGRDAP